MNSALELIRHPFSKYLHRLKKRQLDFFFENPYGFEILFQSLKYFLCLYSIHIAASGLGFCIFIGGFCG